MLFSWGKNARCSIVYIRIRSSCLATVPYQLVNSEIEAIEIGKGQIIFFRLKIARIADSLRRFVSKGIFQPPDSLLPCVLTGYGNEVVWLFSFLPTLRRVILPVPSHVLGTGLLII